jgi:putative nucleotidyltransferase with HDIG domain
VSSRLLVADDGAGIAGLPSRWFPPAGFDPVVTPPGLPLPLRAEIACAHDDMRATIRGLTPRLAKAALLELLAERAPDTYQHTLRVARMSTMLARAVGVRADQIPTIRRAALLHDVGKIAVPARILAHPGRPCADGLLALRLHVTIGQEIVSAIETFATAAMLVGATHEQFDGSGYPHGLRGTEIPLGARIIAVADTYDAMTSVRPYRTPRCHREANGELTRVAGTQLDPDIVRAWTRVTEGSEC